MVFYLAFLFSLKEWDRFYIGHTSITAFFWKTLIYLFPLLKLIQIFLMKLKNLRFFCGE